MPFVHIVSSEPSPGAPFELSPPTPFTNFEVTQLSNGGFVATWGVRVLQSDYDSAALFQIYDEEGHPVGGAQAAYSNDHEVPSEYIITDAVARSDGGFVMAWSYVANDINTTFVQHFAADGTPVGPAQNLGIANADRIALIGTPGGYDLYVEVDGTTQVQAFNNADETVGSPAAASFPSDAVRLDLPGGEYLIADDGVIQRYDSSDQPVGAPIPLPSQAGVAVHSGDSLFIVSAEGADIVGYVADGAIINASGEYWGSDEGDSLVIGSVNGSVTVQGLGGDDSLSLELDSGETGTLYGGNGRDTLWADTDAGETVRLYGEDGDDQITVSGAGAILASGADGDDVITLNLLGAGADLGLGAGVDRIVFGEGWAPTGGASTADFTTGAAGDVIDLDPLLASLGLAPGADAFADYVRIVQNGTTVTIRIDPDGAGSGDTFHDLLSFRGNATRLTAANFDGRGPGAIAYEGPYQVGTAAPDTLGGNGVLEGLGGDDILTGGAGGSLLLGGDGNDQLRAGSGYSDLFDGGAGLDTVSFENIGYGLEIDVLASGDRFVSIEGYFLTALDDEFYGSNAGETIWGGGGNDYLVGRGGNDIYVIDNFDTVVEEAGGGIDRVRITRDYTLTANVEGLTLMGNAVIGNGNELDNTIEGNDRGNTLDGKAGADQMWGGLGNDSYYVDNVGDRVFENADEGIDTVFASASFSAAGQHIERVTLTGTGNINATGNSLDNILRDNAGINRLTGGAGNDTYYVSTIGDAVIEAADGGDDLVYSSVTFSLAGQYVERLTLTGSAHINATGNGLANGLTGNDGNNRLDGGAGADTMVGGFGNDIYVVDNAGDVAIEANNAGTDTVLSSVTFSLAGQYVEALTLTGSAAINGTGNGLANAITGNGAANVLTGGVGNDTLDGGAGADRLVGGVGDDLYYVDNAGDVVIENANEGTDRVYSSVTFSLAGQHVEALTLTGSASVNGTGNGLANTLTGNSGANRLDGGAGADTMAGGAGDDTYVVDDAGDLVIEANGTGHDTVLSSVAFSMVGQYLEDLTLTGSAAINGRGNSFDNVIRGNGAANTLDGSTGNDTLSGGLGVDTLTGGAGQDRFRFDSALGNGNVDVVTDFSHADDTIVLAHAVFGAIATGELAAGAFRIGTAALDADDRILYDSATGNLWYDADGAGGTAMVRFAKIASGLTTIDHTDFLIG